MTVTGISNRGLTPCRIEKIIIEHLHPSEMKMLSHRELYNLPQIQKDYLSC